MTRPKKDKFDFSKHFGTPQELAACLKGIFEGPDIDAAFIAKAFGDNTGDKAMSHAARDTALARERLYKALSGELKSCVDALFKNPNRSSRRW